MTSQYFISNDYLVVYKITLTGSNNKKAVKDIHLNKINDCFLHICPQSSVQDRIKTIIKYVYNIPDNAPNAASRKKFCTK